MNSTVPAVLAALLTTWTAAEPNLQIGQGSLLDQETDFLIVGYDDGDQPAVQGARSPTGARGAGQISETYDVSNVLSVWIGDVDTTAVRVKLFGYFDALDAALTATQPPQGVARWYIGGFSLQQPITGEGSVATAVFTVHVDAWRTP